MKIRTRWELFKSMPYIFGRMALGTVLVPTFLLILIPVYIVGFCKPHCVPGYLVDKVQDYQKFVLELLQ